MRPAYLAACLSLVLGACDPRLPITGGPCAYETEMVSGKVVEITKYDAQFLGAAGSFRVEKHDIGRDVKIGDEMTFTRKTITQGTCTPMIYSVVSE